MDNNPKNIEVNSLIINERVLSAFRRIGISTAWGYELIKRGVLPKPHKIIPNGRAVAFNRMDIDNYILSSRNVDGGSDNGK